MTLKFTRYSFLIFLISFIPFFPIFTLVPFSFLQMLMDRLIKNCELSYQVLAIVCLIGAMAVVILYLNSIKKTFAQNRGQTTFYYVLISVLLYALANTAAFVIILSPASSCHGDGQSIMDLIYSSPFAGFVVLIFGLVVDLRIWKLKVQQSI